MKTIKIIELLNKAANDEKIPIRIKYNDYEYRYHDKKHGYCRSGYDCTYICLSTDYCLFNILNDEVEILEEEKKIPEKLEKYYDEILEGYVVETYINGVNCKEIFNSKYDEMIISKLNEILDYLETKGE